MGGGDEFMRFSELRGEPPLIDGHARRTRGAPVRTIRKRPCATVEQGHRILAQYAEGFEAGRTGRAALRTRR